MEVGEKVKMLFNDRFEYGVVIRTISEHITAVVVFYPVQNKDGASVQHWINTKSLLKLNNLDRLLYL